MSKARDIVETLRTVLVDGDVTNANFTGADLEISKGGTGASSTGAARTALGVAIGTDVLAPDGSAANLTNLPAGGAEDFVASGTLPNGKPVILKANGQVEVVGFSPTSISQSIPAASGVVFNAGSTTYSAVAYDPNTAGKFVIAYTDSGNSDFGTAIVGSTSGTTISFGSEVVFNAGATTHISISFDPNTANKFVIGFKDDGNSQRGAVIVGTISSNSLSFGTEAVFETGVTIDIDVAYDPNTANKFVVAYNSYGGNSGYGTAIVATISSNSISYGSKIVYNSAQSYFNSVAFDPNTANKLVIAYRNVEVGTAIVGTVSSNSISFGTPSVFETPTGGNYIEIAYDPNTANKFVIVHADEGNSNFGTAIVGTVSSTSISFGSPVVFNSGNTTATSIGLSFDKNTATKFVIAYKDTSNSTYITVIEGTLGSTSVTFGSEIVMNSAASDYPDMAFDPSSYGKFVVVYKNEGNSNYGTARLGQIATTEQLSNLTSTNFLGTATAAYTNGQTASIMLKGGISDNQTSLTAGSTYYVQPAGTFATSAGTPSVLAGEAVSATSLLLNGLATPDEIPSQTSQTGKFLTTNGSAASWGTVAAGLVHISTVTASNVSSAEFTTSLSSYESFIVVCTGFYPATNSAKMHFRFNNHANNYTGIIGGVNDGGSSYALEQGNEMVLSYDQNSNAANADLTSAQINIFGNASGEYKNVVGISGYRSSSYGQMSMNISGGWRDTAALTSIKFLANTGNIYGKFMLYGVTTS